MGNNKGLLELFQVHTIFFKTILQSKHKTSRKAVPNLYYLGSNWPTTTVLPTGAAAHSGAYHALTLHRIIEINLSIPMESNYGFGS